MELHKSVHFNIYINPDSGPPDSENTDFTAGFALLKQNGNASHLKIYGYVPTGFGAVSINTVRSDIDKYYQFWPNDINGILIDEMTNIAGSESYYQSITDYLHSNYGNDQITIGNPGTSTSAAYINTVDEIQISETTDYPTLNAMQTATMNGAFNKNKFHIGIHSATVYNAPLMTEFSKLAGNLFITNDVLPNPYDTLSGFLQPMALHAADTHVNKKALGVIDTNSPLDLGIMNLQF